MMQVDYQSLRSDEVLVDGFVLSEWYSGQLSHQTYDCGCLVTSEPLLELPDFLSIIETIDVLAVMSHKHEAAGV